MRLALPHNQNCLFLLPLHHIQRALHAFFADVNEQALHLMMNHPECEKEAQRIVRKSNALLRQHIGTFKSKKWQGEGDAVALKQLCRIAEQDSLALMRRIQMAPSQAINPRSDAETEVQKNEG